MSEAERKELNWILTEQKKAPRTGERATILTRLDAYETKEALFAAYVRKRELDGLDPKVAAISARGKAVYSPHLYRGGWVIRGFGFSMERIGKYVTADDCGHPEAV